MINIKIPTLEEAVKNSNGTIEPIDYQIYSSIYKPFPTVSIGYKSSYVMPDALNFFIGNSNVLTYTSDAKEDAEYTNFGNFSLTGKEVEGTGDGIISRLFYNGSFDFYQRSDIRKIYKNSYGNDIIKDLIASNNHLNKSMYTSKIEKTDNTSTVYRSLGENDVDFIEKSVYPDYIIDGGKPLFFIGLDDCINFTSINHILNGVDKPKFLLKLNTIDDKVSAEFNSGLVNSLLQENYSTLTSKKFKFQIGTDKKYKNIKTVAYYTSFNNSNRTTVEKLSFLPATSKPRYYPLSKMVFDSIDATQSIALCNRPQKNIIFEAQNDFDSFEDLIRVNVTIENMGQFKDLLIAGQKIFLLTPYPYSLYNGEYVVSSIEYFSKSGIGMAQIECARPYLDETFIEKLADFKDSDQFQLPFAPQIPRDLLYKV